MKRKISIAIIDQKELLTTFALNHFENHPTIELLYTSRYCKYFLKIVKPKKYPDIVFFVIQLFSYSKTLEELSILRNSLPKTKIVLVGNTKQKDLLGDSLNIGINGFVSNYSSANALEHYILMLQEDSIILSNSILQTFLIKGVKQKRPLKKIITPENYLTEYIFSVKEKQVAKLLCTNASYQEIADLRGISINNCRYYIKKIYKKVGCNNRSALILKTQHLWKEDK
jgi:DNA-binding NarL/FixJ family response regulator